MSVYDINGDLISGGSGASAFVNVKTDFGAKGDGAQSDSIAIQNALNSLSTSGGIIFFPKGTYLLTSSVLFYSNQTLWFENGATLLQGGNINNLLMSYCMAGTTEYNGTHDCLIYGATFDGGSYEINNTLVGIIHSKNIIFENCTFKNAYGAWHNLEINSSYNCKVVNCDFEGSRKTDSNGCMIQVDSINGAGTWPWENRGAIDGTISKHIDISGSIFHDSTIAPAIGNHSSALINYLRIHDCVFVGLTTSRAAVAFMGSLCVDIANNTFVDCTRVCDNRSGSLWIVHDNIVDGATSIGGFGSKWNNFVDGALVS